MDHGDWKEIERGAADVKPIAAGAALAVLQAAEGELPRIMAATEALRSRFFGRRVSLCSILNAKSGACSEDCIYCAQSARHHARIEVYGLRDAEAIGAAYRNASEFPIAHFGVVTSGEAVSDADVDEICRALRLEPAGRAAWCASLGCLSAEQLGRLKAAGLRRYHHNLETARSFFPRICTTHTFEDRIRTVRAAREAGLEVCSGGLMGLGESAEQRVEFALTLSKEGIVSIPLNFLVPIPGTTLERQEPMRPLEILKCIAMCRLTNPAADIRICGGRVHLRDLQSMIFFAGASSMMCGPLLTVPGRAEADDLRMLADLGLTPDA